jgi:signal transduction histidine kinase
LEKILLKLTEILDIDYRSIKTKLLLWFGGILFLILLIFSIGFYYFYKKSVILSYENSFTKIANYIKSTGDLKNIKHYEITLINKPIKHDKFFINFKDETFDVFYLLKYGNKTVKIAKFNIDNKIENVEDSLLVSIPILMLILLILANLLLNKILTPIKEITKKTNSIDINIFPSLIITNYKEKEIKDIVNAFNAMILRIQDGIKQMEQFNSDISHELKTPLSIIKAQIQLINDQKLDIIKKEVENIENLIEGLLILTKYNKDNISQTFKKLSIDSILIDVLSSFDDKRIEIEKLEYVPFFGNEILLKSAFSNIIDNALKYSSKSIKIFLYKRKKIFFIVRDYGIGIEKDKLKYVTDRLYRADESRNKKINGFGLGLSIVQKVANLHNAKLRIISKPHKGTTVILTFQV